MIAKCPNDCKSGQFETVAHITEFWIVDKQGSFVGVSDTGEVTHGPDPDNIWMCNECGEEAEVVDTFNV